MSRVFRCSKSALTVKHAEIVDAQNARAVQMAAMPTMAERLTALSELSELSPI